MYTFAISQERICLVLGDDTPPDVKVHACIAIGRSAKSEDNRRVMHEQELEAVSGFILYIKTSKVQSSIIYNAFSFCSGCQTVFSVNTFFVKKMRLLW